MNDLKALVLSILVIGNFLGFITYPYFYGPQIDATNPLLRLFVPDCQLAALLFSITSLTILMEKDNKYLNQLGIAASIKYGLWTLIVLLSNFSYYLSINPETLFILTAGHIILVLESSLIFDKFKLSKAAIPAFLFLGFNDFSDYVLGTHPPLPPGFLFPMIIITPLITIGLIALSYYNSIKIKKKQ